MKKIIIILIQLIYISSMLYPKINENEKNIKRKILILPFYNKNNVTEYNYLSDVLMETLRSELLELEKFDFTNFTVTKNKLNESGYKNEDLIKLDTAQKIAKELKADMVITGQYVIVEKKIMILIHTLDIFSGDLVGLTKINGNTGVDVFSLIDQASDDTALKIKNNYEQLIKSYKKHLLEIDKKNIEKYKIRKKTGIALSIIGSSIICIGLPIMIYDLAGYGPIMEEKKNYFLETNENYNEYNNAYNTFIGLFASSVSLITIGVVITAVGIPLISVYSKKIKNISFDLKFYKGISAQFVFRF